MAKATQTKKSTPKKSKTPVRDIKRKSPKKEEAFRIHHLEKEDGPAVEPLIEVERIEDEFEISKVPSEPEESEETPEEELKEPEVHIEALTEEVEAVDKSFEELKKISEDGATESIRVRFDKFVQLILSHDLDEVIDANADQEIIMSSNLLTDLAGSQDVKEERKTPLVFIVGIAMGIILTYLFLSS